MGRPRIDPEDEAGWQLYLTRWMAQCDLSNADLSRATGIGESNISRWRRGISGAPDVESCRRLAHAIGRPMIEVLVACGHLSPSEAREIVPQTPPQMPPTLARLAVVQRVLDDPKMPEATRVRLRVLLDLAVETATAQPGKEAT